MQTLIKGSIIQQNQGNDHRRMNISIYSFMPKQVVCFAYQIVFRVSKIIIFKSFKEIVANSYHGPY